ncbi:MAG: segregation/condensation protein A [Oligoflexia bacterium]|nr:segregation/condensation protein A [Oligoflexia bacterium]
MLETDILVKTDNFDGPLGLLLLLIQREEMDIKGIDISIITDQYLKYLNQMKDLNFDIAGDFLFMAATLLHIKSQFCIQDDNSDKLKDIDLDDDSSGLAGIASKSDLIRRLEELQHFQNMGKKLWGLTKVGHEVFTRSRIDRKAILDSLLLPMELNSLTEAMIDIIKRNRSKLTFIRDPISVKDKLLFLKNYLVAGKTIAIRELLEEDKRFEGYELQHVVVTFICLLELTRLKKVQVFQSEHLNEIYVEVIENLQDFDIGLVDNFVSVKNENENENKANVIKVDESKVDKFSFIDNIDNIENIEKGAGLIQ